MVMLLVIALVIGAMMPLQAIINSHLGQHLHSPFAASFVSFVVGALVLGVCLLIKDEGSSLKRLTEAPPWMLVGGVLASIFATAALLLVPRLGAAAMMTSFVAGQLILSVVIDHYGFLGLPVRSIDWMRIVGMIMLVIGVVLIVRPGHAP